MELQRLINILIADVYKRCNIKSFPFDCKKVLKIYGFSCRGYSTISDRQRAICLRVSDDACIFDNVIYYNDKKTRRRIIFTLMHELGHILLGHTKKGKKEENEADYFASCILAPRIMIHQLRLSKANKMVTADDISNYFDISIEAANYAVTDYNRWFDNIAHTTRKPTDTELAIKELFAEKQKTTLSSKRKTEKKDPVIRYLLDTSNDEYFIREMERRRTEPY